MNPDKLREIITAEVVRALAVRADAQGAATVRPGNRTIAALLTGSAAPSPDFAGQVQSLRQQQFEITAIGSHTFLSSVGDAVLKAAVPGGKVEPSEESAAAILAGRAVAVIMPSVSPGTAAKVALGLTDSVPSVFLARATERGIPVIVGRGMDELAKSLRESHPEAAPAVGRIREQHLHTLQQLGFHFVPCHSVARTILDLLSEPVNETPQRLARTRPSPKREFITAEDVWKVADRGMTVLTHSRSAVVTEEAREYAARAGIELRAD